MHVQARTTSLVVPAIIAGIIGGFFVDTFLSLTHHVSPIVLWSSMAATTAGPGSPWWIGLVVHVITSIVWALLYAYIFSTIGQMENWLIGGVAWGVLVTAVMSLLVALKTGSAWSAVFAQDFLGTDVFYALPMAFFLAQVARRR
jgi:hypothetical protein